MRHIVIQGNLVRDAEMRQAGSSPVVGFTLAVNRRRKKDDDTPALFFDVSAFDGIADRILPYLTKGKPISVTGDFDVREYERKDGTSGFGLTIRAKSVDFINFGSRQNDDGAATASAAPADVDADDVPW